MPRCTKICSAAMAVLFAAASAIHSQTAFPAFQPLEPIAFDLSGPVLRAHTEALKPFTVAGEHGVLVGQGDHRLGIVQEEAHHESPVACRRSPGQTGWEGAVA